MEFKQFFFWTISSCYFFFLNSSISSIVLAHPHNRTTPFCPSSGKGVVAMFGSSSASVEGKVEVKEGGRVNVNILISKISDLPGGEQCLKSETGEFVGFKYHIHMKWQQEDAEKKWASGEEECSALKTGGHWDPTLACGPASGNELCKSKGIEPSSSGGKAGNGTNGEYVCNESVYAFNAFSCEMGDLSGKYGFLNSSNISSGKIKGDGEYIDVFLSNWCLMINKSVVFHCQDGKRAFCAKFEKFEKNSSSGGKKGIWNILLIQVLLFVVFLIHL